MPDGVLFGSSKAHKELRCTLVEEHKLDAVIKLPSGVFRPYAGVSTAILVFTKTNSGGTEHVWFYDCQADGRSLDDKRNPLLREEKLGPLASLEEGEHVKNNLPDLLMRWEERDGAELAAARTAQSFCVPKADIAAQGYDPAANPKVWPVKPVGDFCIDVTNGLTRRRKDADNGQQIVLRLRDIRAGWIDFSDVNRITLNRSEAARYEVAKNDLLFIRVNGNADYVGRCAVFEGLSETVFFNDHIMRVKLDNSAVSAVFLTYILNNSYGKSQIALRRKTSAGQDTINQNGLSLVQIPLPKIDLQNEFELRAAIAAMPVDNFLVRPKLRFVERYAKPESWATLGPAETGELIREVAALPSAFDDGGTEAKLFDLLILKLQIAVVKTGAKFA